MLQAVFRVTVLTSVIASLGCQSPAGQEASQLINSNMVTSSPTEVVKAGDNRMTCDKLAVEINQMNQGGGAGAATSSLLGGASSLLSGSSLLYSIPVVGQLAGSALQYQSMSNMADSQQKTERKAHLTSIFQRKGC